MSAPWAPGVWEQGSRFQKVSDIFFPGSPQGEKNHSYFDNTETFWFFFILILTSVQWSIPEVSGSPPSDNAIVLTSTEIHACISKCFSILTSNMVTHTTYSEDPEQSLGGQIFKRPKRKSFEIWSAYLRVLQLSDRAVATAWVWPPKFSSMALFYM